MKRQLVCLTAVLGLLSGCGIGTTGPTRAGAPASGLRQPGSGTAYAQLYFVGTTGLQAAARRVDTPATPQQAVDLLLDGPDAAERARGLATEVPTLSGELSVRTADGTVDLRLPTRVAQMNGGGLGLSQIVCTAANAQVPGDRQPPDVDVRVYEKGISTPWTVRCDASGTVVPVPESGSGSRSPES